MQCDYDGFEIEPFEAGRGLWHARIWRADRKPVIIDGVLFAALEVGSRGPIPKPQSPMPKFKSTASSSGDTP
jgi:hypothetical protein